MSDPKDAVIAAARDLIESMSWKGRMYDGTKEAALRVALSDLIRSGYPILAPSPVTVPVPSPESREEAIREAMRDLLTLMPRPYAGRGCCHGYDPEDVDDPCPFGSECADARATKVIDRARALLQG